VGRFGQQLCLASGRKTSTHYCSWRANQYKNSPAQQDPLAFNLYTSSDLLYPNNSGQGNFCYGARSNHKVTGHTYLPNGYGYRFWLWNIAGTYIFTVEVRNVECKTVEENFLELMVVV